MDAFEAAVAGLEGAEDAEAFSSGMAAISAVFMSYCSSGDRIVAARQLYGNTFSLLRDRLAIYGIGAQFFDVDDHEGIEQALDGANLLHCETIGNPRVKVADLDQLGKLAQAADVPLVVDNTFASPVLCRPLEHGATIVVHSATKFLGGHHDLLGGVACGSSEALAPVKELARDLGPSLAPFNAWLGLRGLSTIHLRVARSCNTALELATFLERHPRIRAVHYPALDSSPDRPLADSLLGGRGGGTLAFDVAGDVKSVSEFQEKLGVISPAASLGGTHSLIVHAASITHTQLTSAELRAAGISEGFCRLSVGLEDPDDLIADLDRALASL